MGGYTLQNNDLSVTSTKDSRVSVNLPGSKSVTYLYIAAQVTWRHIKDKPSVDNCPRLRLGQLSTFGLDILADMKAAVSW